MSLDRVHISFELSRPQLLAGHIGTWMCYWPGVMVMLGIMAFILAMSWRVSPWFLLFLFVLFPVLNNVVLFVAGFVRPLLFGREHVEVIVEERRIGYRFNQVWHWLPLEEVDRVARFGGVCVILSLGNVSIYIPASAIDEKYIAHIRAETEKSRQTENPRPAADPGPMGSTDTTRNDTET